MRKRAHRRLWSMLLALAVVMAAPTGTVSAANGQGTSSILGQSGAISQGWSSTTANDPADRQAANDQDTTLILGESRVINQRGGSVTSNDPEDWQVAIDSVDNDELIIYVTGRIELSDSLTVNSKDNLAIHFVGSSDASIIAAESKRHLYVNDSPNIILNFDGVTLNGDKNGGGIESRSSGLTLQGAEIIDCYRESAGAGLLFDGQYAYPLTIIDSIFKNNAAPNSDAGAALIEYAPALFIDSATEFEGNQSKYNGGALYIGKVEQVEIAASFKSNLNSTTDGYYHWGGAVYVNECGKVSFDGARFESNTAQGGGGAISVHNSASLQIKDGSFTGNKAQHSSAGGGAVYATNIAHSIDVTDVDFSGNYTGYSGSAVYLKGNENASITIEGGAYQENNAGKNGTLAIEDSAKLITISGSVFERNTAVENAGGINLAFGVKNVVIDNIKVEGNIAGNRGGGIAYETGTTDDASIVIRNSRIVNNEATAENGGGIFLNIWASGKLGIGNTGIVNTVIEGNRAGKEGGGIMLCNSVLTITDSTISGNWAALRGGGIALEQKETEETVTVTGTTIITGNAAGIDGGGIFLPFERVEKTTVGAGVEFSDNSASSFAVGFKNEADETFHLKKIHTKKFSNKPGTGEMFKTAYNNYDINYTRDIPEDKELRVSYVGNGGIISESGSEHHGVYVNAGDTLTEPGIDREGYTFLGWFVEDSVDSARWNFKDDKVEKSLTLYAQWKRDGNGGGTPEPDPNPDPKPGPGPEPSPNPTPNPEPSPSPNPSPNPNPGGSSSGGSNIPDIFHTVDDLYRIDEEDIPLAQQLTLIDDDDIPLSALPITGISQGLAVACMLCAVAVMVGGVTISGDKESK